MASVSVTSPADSGPGSLREAIATVKASGDPSSTITFTVAGTIVLNSALAPITTQVTIDGRSAPRPWASPPPGRRGCGC